MKKILFSVLFVIKRAKKEFKYAPGVRHPYCMEHTPVGMLL